MEVSRLTSSTPGHVLRKRKRLRALFAHSTPPQLLATRSDDPDEASDEERPAKKQRKSNNLEDLPWKQVQQPTGVTGFETDGVMLMVEEVDDVDIVYSEQGSGRKQVSYHLKVSLNSRCILRCEYDGLLQVKNSKAKQKSRLPEQTSTRADESDLHDFESPFLVCRTGVRR